MMGRGTATLGKDTANLNLTFIFLLISIVSSIILVPLNKFRFTKGHGYYLFILYFVFLIIEILLTLNIISIPFITPK